MRSTALLLVLAQVASLAPDALAQFREVALAPAGAPVPVITVGQSLPVSPAPAPLTPALVLPRATLAATARAVATTLTAALIRTQSLAGSVVSKSAAAGLAAVTLASGRAAPQGSSERSPLAKALASPSVGTLQAFYDRAAPAAEPDANGAAPLDEVQVFLVQDGKPAVRTTFGALPGLLAGDPALARALNREGKVRFVIDAKGPAGGLTPSDVTRAEKILREHGVTAALQRERIAVDRVVTEGAATEAPPAPEVKRSSVGRGNPFTWPFRELAFLGRAMKAAYTKPQFWEVIGGLGTEGVAFAMTAGTFAHTITFAHPVLLGASVTLLLAQNAFHGFWLNTWNNFQDNLNKFRGPTYQTVFNWAYFQLGGTVYRTLAWAAHPATTVAAWTWEYWKAIGVMSVVGTFVGVLGYNGLNQLYDKGRLNRWQRSALQQGRNLLFLGMGPLYAAGVLWLFWPLFWTLQSVDVILFVASLLARARPIVYVADPGVAAAPEFKAKYPATAATEAVSPWTQAAQALKAQPPVMLALYLYKGARWIRRKLSGKAAR